LHRAGERPRNTHIFERAEERLRQVIRPSASNRAGLPWRRNRDVPYWLEDKKNWALTLDRLLL
jgi:hypothetical protein